MVSALNLRSGDPEFKSRSNHQLNLFQVVSGSAAPVSLLSFDILNLLSSFQSLERVIIITHLHRSIFVTVKT